jgi:hypothetical protein
MLNNDKWWLAFDEKKTVFWRENLKGNLEMDKTLLNETVKQHIFIILNCKEISFYR